MSIFLFSDYRRFLKDFFAQQPQGRRGYISRIAKLLGVHSTFVGLVMREERDLSLEQALRLAQHIGLDEAETDYFMNLVTFNRAGNQDLKKYAKKKIEDAQTKAKNLSVSFEHDTQLQAEERQIFYSSWHYSAIRVYTSTHAEGRTADECAEHFHLPRAIVVDVIRFLVGAGLLVGNGSRFQVGPQRTFLEKGHPLLKCHHSNWRLKALQSFERLSDDEMMFTSTVSLSKKDFQKLRGILTEFVRTTSAVLKETEPEDVACVNLDLFWVR